MAEPRFDTASGRWYIRYLVEPGKRVKKYLPKHDGWKKSDKKPRTVPPQVIVWARPFQDADASVKLGHGVKLPRATSVKDFLDGYARSYELSARPNSRRSLARTIRCFLEYCEAQGIKNFEAVTVPVCRAFLEKRTRDDAAYSSIKSDRALLRAAWSRATEDGTIDSNPWSVAKVPGKDRSDGTPHWSNSEVAALLDVLSGMTRDIFLVGINCGFRCQAIRLMRWDWIDWAPRRRRRGTLTCPEEHSKSGKAYSVPLLSGLHDVLARLLVEAADSSGTALVFPGKCADGGINASGFEQRMKKACVKAGIAWKGHAWHSMRATFATRYLEMGYSPRAVQAWMSHASLQMTDKYLGWDGESEDDEIDKVEGRKAAESPVSPGPGGPPAGP